MDEYFTECRQELRLSIKDVVTTKKPQFQINFQFSCKPIHKYWVIPQDSTEPQFVKEVGTSPLIHNSVRVNLKQLMRSNKTTGFINGKLRNWPVEDHIRQDFINTVWDKARDLINSMPTGHNVLEIHFHAVVCHNHVFDENRVINSMIQSSMEETDSAMIPATDSSIESLEIKTINASDQENHGSCSICLEDLSSGCEGICMPCSHIFHGNCIKKWLKTSHYCPVCRFEMPTSC